MKIFLICVTTLLCTAAHSNPQAPRALFKQDAKQLDEVSGLGRVRTNPKLLWMHNDSGDTPRLFAVNRQGKIALTVNLIGANAFDWEDMSASGKWVYAGDIGDNFSIRQNVQIYRFAPPAIGRATELDLPKSGWQQTTLSFPDGARNCESLAAAPDGRLLLVSKEADGASGFYVWNRAWKDGARGTMTKIGSFHFGGAGGSSPLTTGADFSPDGRKLVVTTYSDLIEFRLRRPFDFASLNFKSPAKQPLPAQKQCEAVCYSLDGRTIYSTGEGKNASVWALSSRLK